METSAKENILVVDDDEDLRTLTGLFLKQKGYHIWEANDGFHALDQAPKLQPDLILLDVMMPGMDGYQVCEKLKQNPLTQDIPVIFLSSLTDSKDKIKGLEIGGVDFINKLGDKAEMLARVQTHLKIRSLNKALILSNQELIKKQKYLDDDLTAAAVIQRSLLPLQRPDVAKLHIAWKCLPCDQIGGDVFNVLRVDDDHVVFYMLDVSGHGVPSAMVTVSVSQHLQEYNHLFSQMHTQTIITPKEMLKILDKEFPLERFDKFFTIFYMVVNVRTGSLLYSNAGHPPAIMLHPDKNYELLEKGGTVIGIDESIPFDEGEKQFISQDKIFLYTDGVTEFQNAKEELYGANRLYNLLEKNKHESIENIIEIVFQSLREFGGNEPLHDDVSMLGLQF